MVVKKDKTTFQTQSHRPNENWMGDEYYLIEDGTNLAEKILANFPNVNFVIENDALVDVTVFVPEPFEGLTNEEIQERLLADEKNIEFLGKQYSVDEADLVFNKYLALNDVVRFTELSEKIVAATNDIYSRYPVEGQEMLNNSAFTVNDTTGAELMLLSTLGFEIAEIDTDLAIETLVEKNIKNITHTPVIGETWREDANYMKGDEVVSLVDNQTYIAEFYNKNKEPSLKLMKNNKFLYWELKTSVPVYPTYEELPQDEILVGTICTYEGNTYECKKQHIKSVLYLPTKASHWRNV